VSPTTAVPTISPTALPTTTPTVSPTTSPTVQPTIFPSASPSLFASAAGSQQENTSAGMTVVWAVVVIVALAILGCLVFAMLRWRHQEKQKAIEVSQWADQRRDRGVTNPLYDVPMEGGDSVTIMQSPYRVATSDNVGLYDVVEPVGDDTYGAVAAVDDAGIAGYLDVGGAEDPPVLDAHETAMYDNAETAINAETAMYDNAFAIPTDDGSSVVAYEASGDKNDGYLVASSEGPYSGDVHATSVEPTYGGDAQYMEVAGDSADPEIFAGFSKSAQSEPTQPSGEETRARYAQAGVVYDIAIDSGDLYDVAVDHADATGHDTVVQAEATPYKTYKIPEGSDDLTSTL
jgi:hypothetical protein